MTVSPYQRPADAHDWEFTHSIYLTRAEAAHYLNLPASWLANNSRSGPRYIKIGGLVRYSVAALDEYMSAHERRR